MNHIKIKKIITDIYKQMYLEAAPSAVFEDLLEKVINPKNSDIFECWNGLEKCFIDKEKNYIIPAKKSKIYVYLESLNQKSNCTDRKRNFQDENLWDIKNLENPYIKNLKDFFDKNIK